MEEVLETGDLAVRYLEKTHPDFTERSGNRLVIIMHYMIGDGLLC